jgi:hypothetical protein
MEKKTAQISIEITEDGNININTNLSMVGALHLMAQAQQVIIQRNVEQADAEQESPSEVN